MSMYEMPSSKRDQPADDIVGFLEHCGLDTSRAHVMMSCPLHEDRTPSLSINTEHGGFFCFSCGAKGSFRRLKEILIGNGVVAAPVRSGKGTSREDRQSQLGELSWVTSRSVADAEGSEHPDHRATPSWSDYF